MANLSNESFDVNEVEIIGENQLSPEPVLTGRPPVTTATATPSLTETYRHSIYESIYNLSSRFIASSSSPGHLTWDEFCDAGDYLVEVDRNWEWAAGRKYLKASGIPCVENQAEQKERVYYDFDTNLILAVPMIQQINHQQFNHFYDVSLTYDPAYQTPRIWLFGYGLDGLPLKSAEIISDMELDFVGSVATLIAHPITGVMNVSIHPCRHAEVMSSLISRYQAKVTPGQFNSKSYLTIFLRLLGSIFPNMYFNTIPLT